MRKKQSEIKKKAKQILRGYGYYLCECMLEKERTPDGTIITYPIWQKSLGKMISEMSDDKLEKFVSDVLHLQKTNPSTDVRQYIESYHEILKKFEYRFDWD